MTRVSTWGQLRYQLLQSNPGTSLDLLDGWLNGRYETVLESGDWTGIHARSTLATIASQAVYSLPADCRSVERILDPVTGFPLDQFTPAELDAFEGLPPIGSPQAFAEIEDTAEIIGNPTIHQIKLYPVPDMVYSLTVEYLRNPARFNGTNLAQSPLSFVSDSILLYGVRADIAIQTGKAQQAQAYEAKFQEELLRLLRVEHTQRRAKPSFRMADRFTRHRLGRLLRGFTSHRF